MSKAFLVFWFSFSCGSHVAHAQAAPVDQAKVFAQMVERINERYDDFFRYQNYLEQRLKKLDEGRLDRKRAEKLRREAFERERLEFVRTKPPRRKEDVQQRQVWEQQQMDRSEEMEMLRLRYVKQKDSLREYVKKGRKIPELKEYGLEGY